MDLFYETLHHNYAGSAHGVAAWPSWFRNHLFISAARLIALVPCYGGYICFILQLCPCPCVVCVLYMCVHAEYSTLQPVLHMYEYNEHVTEIPLYSSNKAYVIS